MKNICCHPKCKGKTRVLGKLGACVWRVCLKCRMTFAEGDDKRPR